jgi:hypothetical protein
MLIQPVVGIFFILLALVMVVVAARHGRTPDGRRTIAARTRFKIAAIFCIVGILLVILGLL